MSFSSDVDHIGYGVSQHRLGRWVEKRGGLVVRTHWSEGIPYVSMRWDRPVWGFLWRVTNRRPWFHYRILRDDWQHEAVEVDTWPRRR